MKVLIACEYSGRTRQAFAALGHDAYSADYEPAEDGSINHYQGDCFDLIGKEQFDLLIAHPPCTYLTNSAEWAYKEEQSKNIKPGTLIGKDRLAAREEAIDFVMRLANAPIERIAIENPIGVLSSRWRKPDQFIQPYEYGDDASKRTCLWLKGLPLLKPTKYVEPRWVCCGETLPDFVGKYGCPNCNGSKAALPRWGNQTNGGQNKEPPAENRWKIRSATYLGWANAFADQWGGIKSRGIMKTINIGEQTCLHFNPSS